MLAPPTYPEWLPPTVEDEVERILLSGHGDEALVLRLATDKRMRFVWRELSKHNTQAHPQLSEAWAIMKKVDVELPQDDPDALTLFFWCAYTIASLRLSASRVSRADLPRSEYELVAAQLRSSAATLRRLNFQHSRDLDFADRYTAQIEHVAIFCDTVTGLFTRLKAVQTPLVVKRNYGSRQARGYVRMLAIEARKLFAKPALYRTLATVASVALMKEIAATQVRKWCDSLDDDA
jgi:hypothetical protein